MSETVVTIHYCATATSSPRPARLQYDAEGNIQTTGGEDVLQGDQLIGLSRLDPRGLGGQPSQRLCGPPESFDAENWVGAEDILSEGAADLELAGWFPAFMSGDGWIYTWSGAVDRVEVEIR